MDVTGVLNFLAYKSKQLDPDKKGINFVLGSFQQQNHVNRVLNMTLTDVPIADVLASIEKQSNLKYFVQGNVVTFLPAQ